MGLLKTGLLALAAVVALFTLEAWVDLQPAFVALMGAVVILAITRTSPGEMLKNIDWSTLFFFIGLFIMVGGLRNSGLTELLGAEIGALAASNIVLSAIALMWISAFVCTVVNRVPYTAAMIPVISHIAATGINVTPLWWALALGVGFGGNAAPFGTTAGIAMMGISERTAHPISFRVWLRSGILVTIVTTGIASVFMYALFGWYMG
jgi:Na+/H+ antiporter NhaD/arsenite permease-like protein